MPKKAKVPFKAVSDVLNLSEAGRSRTGGEREYNLHVSDVIETTGPRAFCARQHVLLYHTKRDRASRRLSPARKMLFATGHFLHDYVVREFMDGSPHSQHIFAEWTCADYASNPDQHDKIEDTYANVSTTNCRCGKPLNTHNEIEVKILGLVGHPDLVLLVDDTYYIWEFKTYDRSEISFDDLEAPLPAHRLQVSCYFKMLQSRARKEGRKVSTRIVIMYIDRSNSKLFGGQPFKSFSTRPFAEKHLSRIRNSVSHFNQGREKKILPDRICPTIRDRRARECECAVECFGRKSNRVGQGKTKHINTWSKAEIRHWDRRGTKE